VLWRPGRRGLVGRAVFVGRAVAVAQEALEPRGAAALGLAGAGRDDILWLGGHGGRLVHRRNRPAALGSVWAHPQRGSRGRPARRGLRTVAVGLPAALHLLAGVLYRHAGLSGQQGHRALAAGPPGASGHGRTRWIVWQRIRAAWPRAIRHSGCRWCSWG